jgi:hypothetical protein
MGTKILPAPNRAGSDSPTYHDHMERAGAMSDKMIKAINDTWQRIQKELPGIADIELFLTNDHNSGCASVNWDDRPLLIRMNLQEPGPGQKLPLDENGKRLPEDILLHLLHLAAHAGAYTPSQGSEGRYHGIGFLQATSKLGVETAKRSDQSWSPASGFAIDFAAYADPNSPAWAELKRAKRYKRELERLEAIKDWEAPESIRPRQRGPVRMRCQCTEETIKAGLRKRGLPETTGLGDRGTKVIAAPKVINVSTGVAERGGLLCADCGEEFKLTE